MFLLPVSSRLETLWRRGDSPAVIQSSQVGCGGCGLSWALQPQAVWLEQHTTLPHRGLSCWPCCPWVASERKMDLGSTSQNSRSHLERQVGPLESQEEKEPIAKTLGRKRWGMGWPCTGNAHGRFLPGVSQSWVLQHLGAGVVNCFAQKQGVPCALTGGFLCFWEAASPTRFLHPT